MRQEQLMNYIVAQGGNVAAEGSPSASSTRTAGKTCRPWNTAGWKSAKWASGDHNREMSDRTQIEWADATWNPLRGIKGKWSCVKTSEGCQNCYAERLNVRFGGPPYWAGADDLRLDEKALTLPLRWKRPRRIFVQSMSDLFEERVLGEWIDRIFAVMALANRHTFQCLTKRPERMQVYLSDSVTPGRVAKAADKIAVAIEIAKMGEPCIEPIPDFPGYLVSDHGDVFSLQGSPTCVRCGADIPGGIARRRYCGAKCRQADAYDRKIGRSINDIKNLYRPMELLPGEDGHLRVMLYRDGKTYREFVHHLVLSVFDRLGETGEQTCHRDGDPSNNVLPNLRWGTQSDNWQDRKRHGNRRSYAKLTPVQVEQIRAFFASGTLIPKLASEFGVSDTQIRNIVDGVQWTAFDGVEWPLSGVWCGVSVETQARADERIPWLLKTPAAVRFLSVEPLLGLMDFTPYLGRSATLCPACGLKYGHDQIIGGTGCRGVDWVVVGGESGGPSERALTERLSHAGYERDVLEWAPKPEVLEWVRQIRDQCQAAGVSFFFKGWGGPAPKSGGRALDGNIWDEFPRGEA